MQCPRMASVDNPGLALTSSVQSSDCRCVPVSQRRQIHRGVGGRSAERTALLPVIYQRQVQGLNPDTTKSCV